MSGVNVKLNGMEEFKRVLKPNVTMNDVKRIVKVNGDRLNRAMKTQTTKSYVKGYSTGDTASSITTEVRDGGLTVAVGASMRYNSYTEYGTRYMSAEPILDPSLETVRPHFLGDLEKVTDK
jgi:HK97 gp10 family phage protein